MITYLKFPIVYYKPPTEKKKILGLVLAFVCFAPAVYGIIDEDYKFCMSIPIVFIIMSFFENLYNIKESPEDILRKKDTILFDENGFQITNLGVIKKYFWCDLSKIHINIISYKNKRRDEDDSYHGTENYISFVQENDLEHYNFFIDKPIQYNFISDFFENKILPTLYQNKTIVQESIIISKLDYTNLQRFKAKHNINRYTDFIYFN